MALVFDNRASLTGQDGIHVLIVGVSDYVNLPEHNEPTAEEKWHLNKLTSAAVSAFTTFEWIRQSPLRLPLKTARLLLSPSAVELATVAELAALPGVAAGGALRATREAFEVDALAWREDAKGNPNDMTIFYFAGHGMQRGPEEGVLLLEDFLKPGAVLARSFEIGDIRNGMAPSEQFPDIALTQFYFIDACLSRPETQKKFVKPQVPDVFGAELNVVDRREAPMPFSTVDGALAISRKGKPSFFAEALKLALDNAAEDPDDSTGPTLWPITSMTIKTALDAYYAKKMLGTKVKMGGIVGQPVLRYLNQPPAVDISIHVQPENVGTPCDVWLYDDNNVLASQCNAIAPQGPGLSFETTVKAGFYRVQIVSDRLQSSPYRSGQKFVTQRGPWPWLHNLAPIIKSTQ